VCRFLALFRVVRAFQERAIFFETGLTPEKDQRFLQYARALELSMTDARLFAESGYDINEAVDHFFKDQLRSLRTIDLPDSEVLTFDYFEQHIAPGGKQAELFRFFAGFGRSRTPLRWDRIMTTELLIMAFLDSVGFVDFHRSSSSDFQTTVDQLTTGVRGEDPLGRGVVRDNLPGWIEGLDVPRDTGMKKLLVAVGRSDAEPG
jgi:hypothetical protein